MYDMELFKYLQKVLSNSIIIDAELHLRAQQMVDSIIEGKAIAEVWNLPDIFSAAEGLDKPLTKSEAKQVLALLAEEYNPEFGITWGVVYETIDTIIEQRNG